MRYAMLLKGFHRSHMYLFHALNMRSKNQLYKVTCMVLRFSQEGQAGDVRHDLLERRRRRIAAEVLALAATGAEACSAVDLLKDDGGHVETK